MLERLVLAVEHQWHQMSSRGLVDKGRQESSEGGLPPAREELQQLSRTAQLWPLMEELALLNQLRLSTDILHLALSPG